MTDDQADEQRQREIDLALLKIEKQDLIYDFFHERMNLDEKTAMLMASASINDFNYNGVVLTYGKTNRRLNDGAVAEHFRTEYPNIFAPPKSREERRGGGGDDNSTNIESALIADALAGSLTAKGRVFVALGLSSKDPAAVARLDAFLDEQRVKIAPGGNVKDDAGDLKLANGSNPWHPDNFNLLRQMQIFKADPALAARLSKPYGGIGATPKQARRALG